MNTGSGMPDPFTVQTGFLQYPALQTFIVPEKTLPWPVDEATLFPQSLKHLIITESEDYAPHIVARIIEHRKHGVILNLVSVNVHCSTTEEQRIHDPLIPQETNTNPGLSVAFHFSKSGLQGSEVGGQPWKLRKY
jgi:hypothetical protein